ncbi:MAG: DUF4383 domain-containing protein [Acidimicrobiales bacterium]
MAVVQILAGVVGAVFLLVGILGFIPGATTNFGDFGLIGPEPAAKLLGLFTVSVVHNIVHLAFGVAGLLTFRRAAAAGSFLIVGGLLYGVVLVYGLVVDRASSLNFLPINTADNWLHLGLSTGMVLLGVVGTALLRRSPARA